MSYPWPLLGGMIGINLAELPAELLLTAPKSTKPYVYPLPPALTVTFDIVPWETSTLALPPVPSPTISTSCPVNGWYCLPASAI